MVSSHCVRGIDRDGYRLGVCETGDAIEESETRNGRREECESAGGIEEGNERRSEQEACDPDDGMAEGNERRNGRAGECDLGVLKGMRTSCRGEEGIRDGDSDRIEGVESESGVDCRIFFHQSCGRLDRNALAVSYHSARALERVPVLSRAEQLRQLFPPQSIYTAGQKQLQYKRELPFSPSLA
jgi:hypothetical protein